jgi:DNA replication protein DnaC
MDRRAGENLCLVGPAGTGKSHLLVAFGVAAVQAGHRVRYYTAAELVETLYRGLADNSVGKVLDTLLRKDLIIIDLCRHGDYAEQRRGRPVGRVWAISRLGIVAS